VREQTETVAGSSWIRLALTALAFASIPCAAAGQAAPPIQFEGRIDALTGSAWALHAGLGATAPLGTYVRYGVIAGLGGGATGLSGRTDFLARFTLDPFRDKRWAPYGAGGVSAVFGESSRTSLLLVLGIEGPARRGLAPAIELGFGGGVRAGVVLRQAFPRRR
jgi:hypothetical protein